MERAAGRSRGSSRRRGKSILIIERGDYLPREKENWDPTEVFVKNRYVSKDNWYDMMASRSSRACIIS